MKKWSTSLLAAFLLTGALLTPRYHVSATTLTGWQLQSGHWYYYTANGKATGWILYGGTWYYLDSNGIMKTGWILYGGTWYYLDASGAMKTGWILYGGTRYYLDASGAMKTGWVYTGGYWYYLNSSGAMLTGWQTIGGKQYYLYPNGAMAANTTISGKKIGSDGAVIPNTIPNSMVLNVPLLNQLAAPRLVNGCEVTSLAMVLNYHGINVTKNTLADQVTKVPWMYSNGLRGNPYYGFVGDMVNGPGLAVYNGPITSLAQKYVGNKAVNLTNKSFSEVLNYVGQGLPVWIITTDTFAPVSDFQDWNTPQGTVRVTYDEHSVVITGYDDNYVYINNPYGYQNQKLDRSTFEKAWEQMGSQAVVILN